MKLLGKLALYTCSLLLSVGLVFASGVFSIMLYAKASGKDLLGGVSRETIALTAAPVAPAAQSPSPPPPAKPAKQKSVMLNAPLIRQNPELPAGCEITSLAMLLQYYGHSIGKMELAAGMRVDQTALVRGPDGSIAYWGNPNTGYVGDIYGKSRGFGVYHAGLIDQMKKHVPSAVDLTNQEFEAAEQHLSDGFPVLAWTTIDYAVPSNWVQWDTPIGPIRTTFSEHAVLLVGYDDDYVYLNDPLSGKKGAAVAKSAFLESWEAMGRQMLSYTKKKE